MFGRKNDQQQNDQQQARHAWEQAVAPEAVEIAPDHLIFPHGTLFALAVREQVGHPGDPRRGLRRIDADALLGGLPAVYSLALRREPPDMLKGTLRARRTLFEGVLLALAEKTGRRPSMAEQQADQVLDAAESALATGKPAYRLALLVALFAPQGEMAERGRRELETRLRAAGLIPQRFQYIADRALLTLQPGGHLFHGVEEQVALLDDIPQLFPTPQRRVMPAADSIRLGRHAQLGHDVFFSFTAGFDPDAPAPTHAVTLLLGDMGSGKTTLMRLMLLQRLLQGRTVVTLDPEGENNRLCEAVGGVVIPATPPEDGETCLLHPLVAETPAEMLLAARFLAATVAGNEIGAMGATALHEAVQLRWQTHPRHMNVADLCEALELVAARVPDAALVSAVLRPYARGGLLEGFFDRPKARLSTDLPAATWVNFDLSGLREENRQVVHAVMTWFFYHIVTQGKQPVDVFIDEGWRLLRGGPFADLLDELGRRARKRGVGVVLTTHLPGDLVRGGRANSLSLAQTALVGRMDPDEAFAFFRSVGVAESEARVRAEMVSRLPPYTFLAVPAGGRSALFPVRVEVPPAWLAFFERTSVFKGMKEA